MGRQSKKRGGAHYPLVAGLCAVVSFELVAQASRQGGLTWLIVGPAVPPGSTRLWVALPGEPYRPFDRYETSGGDLEATPVLDATLGGNETVSAYVEYRDTSGELVCTSVPMDVEFPPD